MYSIDYIKPSYYFDCASLRDNEKSYIIINGRNLKAQTPQVKSTSPQKVAKKYLENKLEKLADPLHIKDGFKTYSYQNEPYICVYSLTTNNINIYIPKKNNVVKIGIVSTANNNKEEIINKIEKTYLSYINNDEDNYYSDDNNDNESLIELLSNDDYSVDDSSFIPYFDYNNTSIDIDNFTRYQEPITQSNEIFDEFDYMAMKDAFSKLNIRHDIELNMNTPWSRK